MKCQKKRGRYGHGNNAKDPNRLRDTNLNIRVNSGDKTSWQAAAAAAGVTMSDWIIAILNDQAGRIWPDISGED